jgi:chorismate dehydratase
LETVESKSLSKLRVSVVQYLNTAPLVWGFTKGPLQGKYDLSFTVPSLCAEALKTGAADVAIIPAIEYQRIPDLVILPDLAIASKRSVRSLLLIAKKPAEDVARVALDSSSRSTQALTKILYNKHWKAEPEFVEMSPDLPAMLKKTDAALLIGDPALAVSLSMEETKKGGGRAARHGSQVKPFEPPYPAWLLRPEALGLSFEGRVFVYDIVEQWKVLTELPAVLAVWAGRTEAVTAELIEDFQKSRDWGVGKIAEISEGWAQELSLPAAKLEGYLRENIDFGLDSENLEGLRRFFAEAAELGLIAEAKAVEILGARLVARS